MFLRSRMLFHPDPPVAPPPAPSAPPPAPPAPTSPLPADDNADLSAGQPVPYDRFRRVLTQMQTYKTQAEAGEGFRRELETTRLQSTTLTGQLAAERTGRAEDLALYRAGFTTDQDMHAARAIFGLEPEATRQKGLAPWLQGLVAAPDQAPTILQPFLRRGSAAPPAPPAPPTPPAPPRPGDPPPVAPSRTAPAEVVTVEQLRAARERANQTGDWSEFQRLEKLLSEERRRK